MSGRVKKAGAPKRKANGYKMPAPIPVGEVIHDTIGKKKWRIGPSIGVGGFGEIYSACDHESSPKKGSNYPFVIKIEPHENGPLFVEKHFYVRNANKDEIAKYMKANKLSSLGMPMYFGNGSHNYNGEKYRYLVLERYGKDLWSIFTENGRSFPPVTVFQLGLQMLDVLEYIHSRGYVHADIKGANILLGLRKGTEGQAYLVDFGLATRVNDKEFKPDPKCAHNGTIEYTSRDAHLGVSTMRGDLEILGYNMLQWLVGQLPWEKALKQPKTVQDMKETFMKDVRNNIAKQFPDVPDALIKYFEYINTMKPKDIPDYTKCRHIFESYLKSQGKTKSNKLDFTIVKKGKPPKTELKIDDEDDNDSDEIEEVKEVKKKLTRKRKSVVKNGEVSSAKRGRKKLKVKESSSETENCENEDPKPTKEVSIVKRKAKRKSLQPSTVVKIKKTKLTPKPSRKNQKTETSMDKIKRQVSFDSPICEIISDKPKMTKNESVNSSGDIFEDSFTMDGKKIRPKRRLISSEEVIVKKVVKKKVTTVQKPKGKSWKNCPTVVNGRSPPKNVN